MAQGIALILLGVAVYGWLWVGGYGWWLAQRVVSGKDEVSSSDGDGWSFDVPQAGPAQ